MRPSSLVAALLVFLSAGASALAQPTITNGLTAFYSLNGNANDTSGRGRNGTLVNGVSFIADSSRFVAHFDGSSGYISLPTAISNYQDLSVTMWVKTSASDPDSFPGGTFVISRDMAGPAPDWNICIEQGRKIAFQDLNTTDEVVTPADLPSGQWVHVACVANSASQAKRVFINGIQAASASWAPHPFGNNDVPIFIGASTVGSHDYFPGEMADVGFYDRALSSNEVQQIYSTGLFSCTRHSASATATVVNGFVVGATITDPGCGYSNSAVVLIQGGGGSGASAFATVSNGAITGVTMTSAGFGYTSLPSILIGSVPSVSVTPTNVTAVFGTAAALNAAAMVLGPFSDQIKYQWFHNVTNVPSATNATYSMANAQSSDAGTYSVAVSNIYGMATSGVATVDVVFPPVITQSPSNWIAAAGTTVDLAVSVTGTGPISYQWWANSSAITGATNPVLALGAVQTNQAGNYFAVASNAYGSVTSSVANVTVYVPVNIIVQPGSQIVAAHGVANFSVVAEAYPAPFYQWAFNGTNLPGATSSSLTISNVLPAALGEYTVLVSNVFSSMLSAPASLIMSPSILTPYGGTVAIWGRGADLTVAAIGTVPLSYQWFKDGVEIAAGTNATLSLQSVQFTDGGLYSVVVSSPFGGVTNSAQLVVNPAGTDLGMYAGIMLTGAVGYTYEIQYTIDLTVTNSWVSLTNLTLQEPVQLWVDTSTNALKTPHRYYRVLPVQ